MNTNGVSQKVSKKFTQRGFRGMFVRLDEITPGYLSFAPATRQIVSSIDIIFDKTFVSVLAHKFQLYREALTMRPISSTPQRPIDRTSDISNIDILKKPLLTIEEGNDEIVTSVINSEDSNEESENSLSNSNGIYEFKGNVSAEYEENEENDQILSQDNDQNNLEQFDEDDFEYDTEYQYTNESSNRRSKRNRKEIDWYKADPAFASVAREVKKENEPWSIYGDPTLYLPEPRGLKAVLRLQYKDPQAWRVWCRAIRAELTTLIKLSTFVIESPQKGEPVIPTTCTNRVKLLADGDWDKAKSRLCVYGDI